MTEQDEREAFEQWAIADGGYLKNELRRNIGGDYAGQYLPALEGDWMIWQAASAKSHQREEGLRAKFQALIDYGDAHEWGHMPEGKTIEDARAILSAQDSDPLASKDRDVARQP